MCMNANLKAVFTCFIDKSLLKCHVLNDNVANVYLITSLIYVTLFDIAISLTPLFGLTGAPGMKSQLRF